MLSLVLVAGLGTPAFADPQITQSNSPPMTPSEISKIQTAHNIVFDNGGAPDGGSGFVYDIIDQIPAEDFILNSDTFITDFHFVSIGDPTNIEHRIYSDVGGLPGSVLASGNGKNLVTTQIDTGSLFEVWFDLEDPFLAEAGEKYWFAIHSTDDNFSGWLFSNSGGFGDFTVVGFPSTPTLWTPQQDVHSWFLLSGHPADEVVGGELLPIETASLLLASAQPFSWMIPVVLSGIGIGLFVVSRKSENS